MISPKQRQLLRMAVFQHLRLDEGEYRLILRNIGDAESSKDLDQDSFEDVMAFLEGRGFRLTGRPENYFREKVDRKRQFGSERQIRYIQQMAAQTVYPVSAMCMRHSGGRTILPEELDPRETRVVIEAYKAIISREDERQLKQKIQR